MKDIWIELAEYFNGDDSILIGQINLEFNDLADTDALPQFRLYPAKATEELPLIYTGEINLASLITFLDQNKSLVHWVYIYIAKKRRMNQLKKMKIKMKFWTLVQRRMMTYLIFNFNYFQHYIYINLYIVIYKYIYIYIIYIYIYIPFTRYY